MSLNKHLPPFHLAIPVRDLTVTRCFYRDCFGCEEGRSSDTWVDFDFFGHQLVIHMVEQAETIPLAKNPVDGHNIPVPHFGIILDWDDWHNLAQRLKSQNVKFTVEPYIRFKGQVGEQATMFFYDPSGNAIELKAFQNKSQIFAK